MTSAKAPPSFGCLTNAWAVLAVPILAFVLLLPVVTLSEPAGVQDAEDHPRPIYSSDPNDPWNSIFYCLFSRRIEYVVSDEYPEGAPFANLFPDSDRRVSTRTFNRYEVGDRAIDPLYPNFFNDTGALVVLRDPTYSLFAKALQRALDSDVPRSAMARAVMQSDLWSAYDSLCGEYRRPEDYEVEQHRRVLENLIGRLMRKIALTRGEIRSLPANYSAASETLPVPDIFDPNSGWIEVVWLPHRMHDQAAGYRRVTRVFLKPTRPPHNVQKFLNSQRNREDDPVADLDGLALVMQLLLIDSDGNPEVTNLTTDVQARLFARVGPGAIEHANILACEISRRRLLSDPASGGLVPEADDSPVFLPMAGNDYTFASRQTMKDGPPVQVHLRTRCALCHGEDLRQVMTFSFKMPPHFRVPPVKRLDPQGHEAADFVISEAKKRRDFNSLRPYFTAAVRRSDP